MADINVEEIMGEIREEIREKGYQEDLFCFEDAAVPENAAAADSFDKITFNEELNTLNRIWNVPAHRTTEEGFKGTVKKIMQKLTRFYITPIVSDLDNVNAVQVRLFNQMRFYIEEQNITIHKMQDEIDTLRSQMNQKHV